MNKGMLNEIYKQLDLQTKTICNHFKNNSQNFECIYGYYNGHYSKSESGYYEMDYFPIPVITVRGYCDIEVGLDNVTLSTKLTKENALTFDYSLLSKYQFDVYGVEDYLSDYYCDGDSIETLITNIQSSNEKEIGFSFSFNKNINGDEIHNFVLFLREHDFFY